MAFAAGEGILLLVPSLLVGFSARFVGAASLSRLTRLDRIIWTGKCNNKIGN